MVTTFSPMPFVTLGLKVQYLLGSLKLLSDHDFSLLSKMPRFVAHAIRFYHLPPVYVPGSDTPLVSFFHIPEGFSTRSTITLSNPTSVIILGNFNNNLNNPSRIIASQFLDILPFNSLVIYTISSHPLSCSQSRGFHR